MTTTARPQVSPIARVIGTTIAIAACNAVGILGAAFTSTDTAWYTSLAKPSFQPPGWVFGPMWTLLYTLMGVALYRVVVRREQPEARAALCLFAAQLFLNGIWSPIFFGAEAIVVAGVVIGMLVVVLAWTILRFLEVDRVAGALLVPYLAWVSFATVLNVAIAVLN